MSTGATAPTSWKYATFDNGCRMPTQTSNGRSTCYCGASLTIGDTDAHVLSHHMEVA
jgi:hypothetical protein